MPAPITTLDLDDLIGRYKAGESVKKLASSAGVSRSVIHRYLAAAGVPLRGRSDAMRVRMAQTSPEERARLSAAAHDAVRGMVRTDEDLERRARGKQARESHATDEELTFGRLLQERGLSVVPQQAVGKYNVDLAVDGTVAVELFGGSWHQDGRHFARLPQRLVDLADRGYTTLMVWCTSRYPLNGSLVADEVVAHLERARRDPAVRREYRMVWGDGEFAASGCVDDNEAPLKPTRVRRRNPGRG